MFSPPHFRSDFPSIALYSLTPDLAAVRVGVPRHVGYLLCSSAVYFLVPLLARLLPASALTGAVQLTLAPQREVPVALNVRLCCREIGVCCSCTEGQNQRSPVPLFLCPFRNICEGQVCPCPSASCCSS